MSLNQKSSDYKMGPKNVQITKGNSKIIRIMSLKPQNAMCNNNNNNNYYYCIYYF